MLDGTFIIGDYLAESPLNPNFRITGALVEVPTLFQDCLDS